MSNSNISIVDKLSGSIVEAHRKIRSRILETLNIDENDTDISNNIDKDDDKIKKLNVKLKEFVTKMNTLNISVLKLMFTSQFIASDMRNLLQKTCKHTMVQKYGRDKYSNEVAYEICEECEFIKII